MVRIRVWVRMKNIEARLMREIARVKGLEKLKTLSIGTAERPSFCFVVLTI